MFLGTAARPHVHVESMDGPTGIGMTAMIYPL